jgi:glycosyltransferase involved in cell wall biosynthesis
MVIAHGNRAQHFAKKAIAGEIPLVAVAHNYSFKELDGCDAAFALTRHMIGEIAASESTIHPDTVYHVPNMIEIPGGFIRSVWKEPPLIGTLGRFVEKKGFDLFLQALAELKKQGYEFRAVIAGDGPEKRNLKKLAKTLELENDVSFPGWADDASDFLKKIDIFCLPSRHEPFGIVLLEAMVAKLPIVSTDVEGPSEILRPGTDALVVPSESAELLAEALQWLLEDQDRARSMASDAYFSVRKHFSRERVCEYITGLLEIIYHDFHSRQHEVEAEQVSGETHEQVA